MLRALLIDDEPFYYKMIAPALEKAGYELKYARSGNEGLSSLRSFNPDIIILDLRLPDIDGFEIMAILRRDPRFSNTPVIFVSGQNELDNKLKAFEMGADDYLEKPFQPEELVARLGILARRAQAMRIAQDTKTDYAETSTMVAVHSLRGGVGCSSVAVNLALAFYQIWNKPTLLVDAVLAAGQVAMMLDASPLVTWKELEDIEASAIDDDIIEQLANPHPSGLYFVAAPKYPIAVDSFATGLWQVVLEKFKETHEFIVIDTAHDFSDISIHMLDSANFIMMVLAPEMASLRAAVCALNIYDKLGYPRDKIKVTLNHTSSNAGIKQTQIERVLERQVDIIIPNGAGEVSKAIDFGEPFILKNPETPISTILEDSAFQLSDESLKSIPPIAPTSTWKRVANRQSKKK
jgi:pilus assembly protein CpaE